MNNVKTTVTVAVLALLVPVKMYAAYDYDSTGRADAARLAESFNTRAGGAGDTKEGWRKRYDDMRKALEKKLYYDKTEKEKKARNEKQLNENESYAYALDALNKSGLEKLKERQKQRDDVKAALSAVSPGAGNSDAAVVDASGKYPECKTQIAPINMTDVNSGMQYVKTQLEKFANASPEEKKDMYAKMKRYLESVLARLKEKSGKPNGGAYANGSPNVLGPEKSGENYGKLDGAGRNKRLDEQYDEAVANGYKYQYDMITGTMEALENEEKYNKDSERDAAIKNNTQSIFAKAADTMERLGISQAKRNFESCEDNKDTIEGGGEAGEGLVKRIFRAIYKKHGKDANAKVKSNELNASKFWTGIHSSLRSSKLQCKDATPQVVQSVSQFKTDVGNIGQVKDARDLVQVVSNMSSRVNEYIRGITTAMQDSVDACNRVAAKKKGLEKMETQLASAGKSRSSEDEEPTYRGNKRPKKSSSGTGSPRSTIHQP